MKQLVELWKRFWASLTGSDYREVPCDCGDWYPEPSCELCAGTGAKYVKASENQTERA